MDAMEMILTRRSIRKYTDKPVTDDQIEAILNAAMHAPSAGNQQPWHFVVIRDREIMDRISDFHPYAGMVQLAPVVIVVCGDTDLEKHRGFWVQDCSAATQNILLAAHAMGLGAVWAGVFPEGARVEGFKKLLGLPDHVHPLALVPIGYPAETKPQPKRFERSRIHRDKW
jgi:nitroreductase